MTFAETDDVDVNLSAPSLDDADGLWPMVMELFTKIQSLICELLPAMLPLMLHLPGRQLTLTTVAMIVFALYGTHRGTTLENAINMVLKKQ